MFRIDEIFKSEETKHRLTLFKTEYIKWLETQLFEKNGKPYLKCLASDKDRPAKPEEIVRQLWIKKLLEEYHYPKERIKVEYAVWFGSGVSDKSADIVVMQTDGEHPYIIFEVKKPKRKDGLQQLKSYCNAEGSPIGVWSNGEELVILHREEPNIFSQISSIPTVDQTLQDVITEQWTIDKLKQENRLVKERLSLKKIILDLEDLVLANAEGIDDSFDEVFKLIYAKLYDEWAAANDRTRNHKIHFRIYGESPRELYDKINGLFNRAKDKWRGIFGQDEKIRLKPEHLLTCVSFLQDVKLFNANLQVIDEAFEYLITEVAKGKKGQYFTPRWVIDMCVKMLNPKIHERVIDTACGSSGFTVHTIFWIAGEQYTVNGFPPAISEYAGSMVYAIDSSPKAVKIAKALNLIAGDGKSNVYELNSLNPPKWSEEGKAAFRPLLTRFSNYEQDEANQRNFQYFDFDILMTNPPFAGSISEREILRQYRLAEKNGKTVSKIGRDILFIERNLNFLKPGGRMAIVLPQGRLNNTNDLFIRNFLFSKARILAVVGLHPNTFKPHTGTKTSVVFLQKYTDEELANIREVQNRHIAEWDNHYAEIRTLSEREELTEDDLPPLLMSFLQAEFEEDDTVELENNGDEIKNEETQTESDDELQERIENLKAQLAAMPGRAKGKAALKRTLAEAERKLASRSIKGQIKYLLDDEKLLSRYRETWLSDRAAEELDYPIFFAVSENGGKDNSGEPIYKKDGNGELMLDEHGHLIVDHDLDEIAEAFIAFAKEQGFDFWTEE
ncbi:MAG: N-6 DNA methylase [Clostridia bacterium]|uniref:N-6 DNA methylase n=1 Tax=Desulfofalx alkaliphila TaxID=105483 RepID=UPI00068B4901|nr:N-6 DNA methylase [Desulfofalx alkaliphila]